MKTIDFKKSLKLSCFMIVLFGFSLSATGIKTSGESLASQIEIATFDIDVTPPLGHDLAYDPVVKTWDMGLRGKGVVLLGAGDPIVLVALDWIGLYQDSHNEFRRALAAAAGTTPERVAVHCLHQHDAVRGKLDDDFVLASLHRLEMAIVKSMENTRPVTHLGTGEAEVFKVASNRRVPGPGGDTVITRFTSCRDADLRAAPEGVIDPDVSVISFWNEDEPLVVLSYYATHPQSYYRLGIPNPDFPGIARFYRQLAVPDALHIHFTGAGGNIGAGKYNDGSHENRGILAERLADGMKRAWDATVREPLTPNSVGWAIDPVILPADTAKDNDYVKRYKKGKEIIIQCLSLNKARVLFMPGELFVEYQLAAKKMRPDLFVAMAAYGDGDAGYIPTSEAFPLGGYEVRVTRMAPEVEGVLTGAMRKLLNAE